MTDESGRAYGEESCDRTGYGHGHEGGTATAAPDSTLPEPHLRATGLPGAGPDHLGIVDSPHGDVITVPPPDRDPPENDPARPVFVDASGRRQRRVRRAARLLVIPAACYVALLISTVLGGPTISAPFVPLPDTPHTATPHATAPGAPAGTGHAAGSAGSGTAYDGSRPGASRTASGPTGRPTASTAAAATSEPTTTPTGTTSPAAATTGNPSATSTATPTAGATAAHSGKGRAVGSSHKPVK
ncbi:hypothetical protein [Streptomyces sp. NPDC091215]|uniref:hypothetical protein n=1 Tax=Streptomyces sp. NPDC091215 TaxID=3155192 RepID=UPI003413718E